MSETLLTEDWLREVGFRWEQGDRQPSKMWLLWLGAGVVDESPYRLASSDDLGIELAKDTNSDCWYCWIRSDFAGRYARLIHVRHIRTVEAVVQLIEGLTGRRWNPADILFGSLHSPEQAARLREQHERLDRQIAQSRLESIDRQMGNDSAKIGVLDL